MASSDVSQYIGLNIDGRIGGKTIFENGEIKAAIEQLDGGMDLGEDIQSAVRRFGTVTPIAQNGDEIEVKACNKTDCARDAVSLRYSPIHREISVCMTKPYSNGGRMSYVYDRSGMREVPSCLNEDEAGPAPMVIEAGTTAEAIRCAFAARKKGEDPKACRKPDTIVGPAAEEDKTPAKAGHTKSR